MNEEKVTDLVIKITSELSALNTNMRNVLDKLTNHENRLMELDLRDKNTSLLKQLVPWLVKGLLICLGIIGTLTGSGALLKNILSTNNAIISQQ